MPCELSAIFCPAPPGHLRPTSNFVTGSSCGASPGHQPRHRITRSGIFRIPLLCLLVAAALPVVLAAQVPTPLAHFGFQPGDDRKLANWDELTRYYDRVAELSDRVAIDTIGSSTGGLPMVVLTVTSPTNHERLEQIRATQLRLADPRTIADSATLDSLRAEAKAIVLLTSHIHSTEVGAGQMPANLLYHLATANEPEVGHILDDVVLILVPSLNPDGTQLIANWYRQHVGTRFEAIAPVELYHPYVGHDNNRDWYALTQKETQLIVEGVHTPWRPMIVHDVHQMSSNGARMFVPPYVEPYEPNIDPLLISAINEVGAFMAGELREEGKTGVVTASQYDLFTPARAFSHYHGGVRILSETASARSATPIRLRAGELVGSATFDPRSPSDNFPEPWLGGTWDLRQIVSYQESAALALLRHAAKNRDFWVDTFYEVNRRAVEKWPDWPDYWILPDHQPNPTGLASILRILTLGGVEVHRTLQPVSAGSETFPAGSFVIPMRQPYASWAQTLLEVQNYPFNLGGDESPPYDVTAHTLPLLMGVRALQLDGHFPAELAGPIDRVDVVLEAPSALSPSRAPRIGIYQGWMESLAAGWTRWLLDAHGIPFTALKDADIRSGRLEERFDVIIFQDQPPIDIVEGWSRREVPAEYVGGVGREGLAAVRRFVERGGRLIAIETSTELAIELFDLRIDERPWAGRAGFYIPGSIVALDIDAERQEDWGDGGGIAWFSRQSRAFTVSDRRTQVLARYGAGDPRLSGLVLGGEQIAGHPALVQTSVGRGSVVLFGFQPNYRGQSQASWPLLFRAIAGDPESQEGPSVLNAGAWPRSSQLRMEATSAGMSIGFVR